MELPNSPGSKEDCLILYILQPWVFLNKYEALGSAPSTGNKQTTITTTTKDPLVSHKIHPVNYPLFSVLPSGPGFHMREASAVPLRHANFFLLKIKHSVKQTRLESISKN